MKNKKKIALVGGLAALFLSVGAIANLSSVDKYVADAELKEEPALQAHYLIGDRFIVPDGTLVVEGNEYEATASVQLPSGKVLRAEEIVLTDAGKYTLTYSAEIGGKIYRDSVDFNVKKEAFAIDGNASTATYDEEKNRVDLSMIPGERFLYNVPVDLSGKTKNDELISTYVTASTTPTLGDKKSGVRDFHEYYIVMTDVYDPSNQVHIRVQGAPAWDNYFSTTNPEQEKIYEYGVYQTYVAVSFSSSAELWAGTEGGKTIVRSGFGTPVLSSFSNQSAERNVAITSPEDDWISIRFDAESNSLYVCDNQGYAATPSLIADLDNPNVFDNNWQGFTDDQCYISIYAKEVETTAHLTVKNIAGLGSNTGVIEDTTPPTIEVDYADYTKDTIPQGVVNEPYRVFDAKALDLHIVDTDVSYKVYDNYNGSTKVLVPVENGAFIPKHWGIYTIEYTAKDAFGNQSQEIVHVKVVDGGEPLSLTAENGNAIAGVPQTIAAPTLTSSDSSFGKVYLTVTAKKGEEISDVVYDGALEAYQPQNYVYMRSGEWDIVYTVSDYSRSSSFVAKVNVNADKAVIFDNFDDLAIDRYFISGNTYVLPVVNVVSFEGEQPSYTPAKIKIVYGDGQSKTLENNFIQPKAADMGGSVQIVYYDETDETVAVSGYREIHDIGENLSLDMTKLFVSDEATITASKNNLTFTATKEATIQSIARQYAAEFSTKFSVFADGTKGNSIGMVDVLLTDAENPNVSVKVTLKDVAGGTEKHNTEFYLNDNKEKKAGLLESFHDVNDLFEINYNEITKKVSISANGLQVATCLNGDPFNGFPSKTVYVSYTMRSVVGESVVDLYSINMQKYTNFKRDNVKPEIVVNGEYESMYTHGTVLKTATAFGIDAISGYSNATVTVRLADGDVLKTVDGVLLSNLDASQSYEVKLDQYAQYLVQYSTSDANGNRAPMTTYSFSVDDTQKPTLEIGKAKTLYFVGEAFKQPVLTVEDDYTQTFAPFAVIVDGSQRYTYVDGKYTFTKAGSYKVILGVFDDGGNLATVEYYVEVVENA